MKQKDLNQYFSLAKAAAVSAGKFLVAYKKDNLGIIHNIGKDIKISADREAEEIILNALTIKSNFPILSEEKGTAGSTKKSNWRWIVDPLDGSLNFFRGMPICCVSIALWEKEKPLLGVIYDFNRGEMFSGVAGKGAWLNSKKISVSKTNNRKNAILTTGFPAQTSFSDADLKKYIAYIKRFKKVRWLGSAALSLAYVASGRADAYFEKDIMIWDVAAGLAILAGAGGKYAIKKSNIKNALIINAFNKYL